MILRLAPAVVVAVVVVAVVKGLLWDVTCLLYGKNR